MTNAAELKKLSKAQREKAEGKISTSNIQIVDIPEDDMSPRQELGADDNQAITRGQIRGVARKKNKEKMLTWKDAKIAFDDIADLDDENEAMNRLLDYVFSRKREHMQTIAPLNQKTTVGVWAMVQAIRIQRPEVSSVRALLDELIQKEFDRTCKAYTKKRK